MKRKDIDDKIPDNCKYLLTNIQAAQNKKQTQEVWQSCLS